MNLAPSAFRNTPAGVAAATTIVVWSAAFPAIAVALRDVSPISLAATRFAIAAGPFVVWLAIRRPMLPQGADWIRVILCGFLGIAAYNVLLNTGQTSVSPGAASFMIASQPVFAAGLSHLLRDAPLGRKGWLGTAVCLTGVGVVAAHQPGELTLRGPGILVLLAAACSGSYFVLQRPLVARYGAATCAALTITNGALLLSPWLSGGVSQLVSAPRAIGPVLFLALGSGVIGYIAWMRALEGFGAARAANLLFLMAPLATLLAIPITRHMPNAATIVGGAIALAGVAIVNRGASVRAPVGPNTNKSISISQPRTAFADRISVLDPKLGSPPFDGVERTCCRGPGYHIDLSAP
jgi:drug/metabolite transporter (DMT)-like permease